MHTWYWLIVMPCISQSPKTAMFLIGPPTPQPTSSTLCPGLICRYQIMFWEDNVGTPHTFSKWGTWSYWITTPECAHGSSQVSVHSNWEGLLWILLWKWVLSIANQHIERHTVLNLILNRDTRYSKRLNNTKDVSLMIQIWFRTLNNAYFLLASHG